jgi:protocatechuate 3,4-dioxygenase beta subunit
MNRPVTRRQALAAFGTVALGSLLAACGSDPDAASSTGGGVSVTTTAGTTTAVQPATATTEDLARLFDGAARCTLTPEQTEGPYYFDAGAIRSDIREDREGTRLDLVLRVVGGAECTPVPSAVIDVWHCDAAGLYSGFESASRGGPGGGRTDEERYLRGAQVTNAEGIARFTTVYPGWYRGRTVHVHLKVHVDASTVLTTQLYFDEATTARVYAEPPYSSTPGPDTPNSADGIFTEAMVMTVAPLDDGYRGVMTLTVPT